MPRTRMYSFALAAVAVGALTAGCASGSGDSSSVELEIWNPETDDASIAVFQSMVDAYEEQNPGVTVNLVNIPWSDIFTKWQTALQSGNAPDATIGSAAFATSFQEQGVLEPLDDVVEQIGGEEAWSDTADSLVEMSKADGSYFALPYTNNAVLLWYNKAMFESEGLTPPTTWDELRDAAETLTHDDQYGILVPSSTSMVTSQSLYSLILSNGGDVVDRDNPDEIIFDDPASVEAIEFYSSLAQYSPPGSGGYDRPEAQAAMTTGKLGMFIYGSWMQAALDAAGPDVASQFAAVPVPSENGEGGAFMGGLSLFAFTGSEHPEETKDLLAFMLEPENYEPYVLLNPVQSIPVLTEVQQSESYLTNEKVIAQAEVIDAVKTTLPYSWFFGLPNPHAGEWEGLNLIAQAASAVIEQGRSAQEAAIEVADEMRASLD
ncbi:ABC transporter substrate-binding protein [Microbacterium sp. NPDC078428]|uniref:ABC transporter substrate-binding protein n=1 Tax=Microbacterium sp. NPDC078428 TaxID=3364190 RepID=UPI0037C749BE